MKQPTVQEIKRYFKISHVGYANKGQLGFILRKLYNIGLWHERRYECIRDLMAKIEIINKDQQIIAEQRTFGAVYLWIEEKDETSKING